MTSGQGRADTAARAEAATCRLDELLGHWTMREAWPAVYGEQLPPWIHERFDKNGVLVESHVVPPLAKIVYPPERKRWWKHAERLMRYGRIREIRKSDHSR